MHDDDGASDTSIEDTDGAVVRHPSKISNGWILSGTCDKDAAAIENKGFVYG